MAETSTDASAAAGIDLSQFYQVFFEEAGENLQNMEQLLLELDIDAADDEELNAIFRCAHSIKGGAATFGFSDVAELTHQMETLLDKLRRHELTPTAPMVDVLLQSGDALKAMLARHQGAGGEVVDTTELLFNIDTDTLLSTGTDPLVDKSWNTDVPGRFVMGQRGGSTVVALEDLGGIGTGEAAGPEAEEEAQPELAATGATDVAPLGIAAFALIALALQLFFIARIALAAWWDPQSTSFQRTQ